MLISLLEVCQEGGQEGGTWRMLRVPDCRHVGQGHYWRHEWCFFTSKKIPWKFCVDISMGSVSGRGDQEGGYLEDIEGSWLETWMTGSLWTWRRISFYPKEDTLKILCWYLNYKYVRNGGGSRRGYLEDVEDSWPETGGYGHPWLHECCFFF